MARAEALQIASAKVDLPKEFLISLHKWPIPGTSVWTGPNFRLTVDPQTQFGLPFSVLMQVLTKQILRARRKSQFAQGILDFTRNVADAWCECVGCAQSAAQLNS